MRLVRSARMDSLILMAFARKGPCSSPRRELGLVTGDNFAEMAFLLNAPPSSSIQYSFKVRVIYTTTNSGITRCLCAVDGVDKNNNRLQNTSTLQTVVVFVNAI